MPSALDDNSNTELRATPSIERRLAAIAFADVAGYSKLMERDQLRTMLQWKALRQDLLEPKITEHGGHLHRRVGDALLIEFQSAVNAVQWAVDVQRGIAEAGSPGDDGLRIRVGINIDDVIFDDGDLHGDGVNIASRIQELASPGEVLVTATVRDQVWNKLGVGMTDLGDRALKNISRPVRIYRLDPSRPRDSAATPRAQPHLAWGNRPSIAVLPFRNLGGVPEEAYFGEGITEDIIGALARGRSLFVIARHSTLPYRDRQVDARQIAAELGVRYILEGSVRRQTAKLRISCELIDASQNRTIWGQNYDGDSGELFEFQDLIAARIVATVEPRVHQAETARVRQKPTDSLDAYDCVMRAFSLLYTFNTAEFTEAGALLDRAIELDPHFAQAHAYKAWWYILLTGEGRSKNFAADAAAAEACAEHAIALDSGDAVVLAVAGHVESFLRKRTDIAVDLFERALEANHNSAFAWGLSASTYCFLGMPEEALERLRNAWRLSPFEPLNFFFWTVAGIAHFVAGRYDEAVTWLRKARRENPRFCPCHRTLVASLGQLGRLEEARSAASDLLAVEPAFRVSTFASWYPLQRPGDLERFVEGLRAAGLPE
jgi:TolB-like protein/class 3 adenylate cyclase/Tfp pilus assembly protein PilF